MPTYIRSSRRMFNSIRRCPYLPQPKSFENVINWSHVDCGELGLLPLGPAKSASLPISALIWWQIHAEEAPDISVFRGQSNNWRMTFESLDYSSAKRQDRLVLRFVVF